MQTTKINYRNLVRQLIPAHKRQPVRLWWLGRLIAPLETIWAAFDKWRSDTRMMINVNSQVAVFEGYLRRKFDEPVAIRVVTFDDSALMVSLEVEAQGVDFALESEDDPFVEVALYGEVREKFGNADFIVYIPSNVDQDAIRAEIERFRLAQMKYEIIQQ